MDIVLREWLGGGTQGDVWSAGDGAVVKFTTSKSEVLTADRLRFWQTRGRCLDHLPRILGVSRTPRGFAILREDVPDIPPCPRLKADLYEFQTGWSYEDEGRLARVTERSPEIRALYADLRTFFELTKIRIADLDHDGNIGGRPDRLVVRDFGLAMGVDHDLLEQVVWDEMTFTEAPVPEEDVSLGM